MYTILRSTVRESGDLEDLEIIQDDALYLVCPSLVGEVGETSYGIRVGFI